MILNINKNRITFDDIEYDLGSDVLYNISALKSFKTTIKTGTLPVDVKISNLINIVIEDVQYLNLNGVIQILLVDNKSINITFTPIYETAENKLEVLKEVKNNIIDELGTPIASQHFFNNKVYQEIYDAGTNYMAVRYREPGINNLECIQEIMIADKIEIQNRNL